MINRFTKLVDNLIDNDVIRSVLIGFFRAVSLLGIVLAANGITETFLR